MGYKVGDMVVYPRHGAAKVEAITERTVKGITREYLQLSVLSSDGLVINVPVDNAKKVVCEISSTPTKWPRCSRFCALRSLRRR